MSLELKGHDRAAALEALRKGEYEAIATSGQGALDALLHLAIELGVFEALEVIKVERERAGIPDELVLRVLAVLPFVEAIGLSAAAGRLMEDAAILLELGELKEGWHLERAPWSYMNDTLVAARVAFTLLAFNIAQIAKTTQGRKLTDRGIRRLRRERVPQYGPAPVIVFTKEAFGVFHIEEVMEALDVAPAFSLRKQVDIPNPRGQPLS